MFQQTKQTQKTHQIFLRQALHFIKTEHGDQYKICHLSDLNYDWAGVDKRGALKIYSCLTNNLQNRNGNVNGIWMSGKQTCMKS